MAATRLIFGKPPTGGRLVFGDDSGSVSAGQITAALSFPEFGIQALAAPRTEVQASIVFPDFGMSAVAHYDQNVSRPMAADARSSWQAAQSHPVLTESRWRDGTARVELAAVAWGAGQRQQSATASRWSDGQRTGRATQSRWRDGRRLDARPAVSRWQDGARLHRATASAWQHGQRQHAAARSRWQDMLRIARPALKTCWQQADGLRHAVASSFGPGRALPAQLEARWQDGITPPPGKWVRPVEPERPPREPNPHLVFERAPTGPHLVFNWSADAAGHVVPVRRTYIVFNSAVLRRVSTGNEVDALAIDISIDRDSWVCSWSAEVDYAEWPALAALNGEPLELEAEINGCTWRLTAEGAPRRSRSFGQVSIRIGGRGHAMWLASPYAQAVSHYNSVEMTAQQLMAQALSINGASLGWEIDWQIEDWLVPAGAWSMRGTPIDGVLDVASAVSAVVQADPVSQILHVLPRYPAKPWEWHSLTPDIEIPFDALDADSIEPVVRPDYNAIIVSGQTQGVRRRVYREGSAADRMAPMVTHPLITAHAAALQRGEAELGNTGRMARVSITMDISEDAPLLNVGWIAAFSEVADPWRGPVTGARVSARMEGDVLIVSQTAELERHYA